MTTAAALHAHRNTVIRATHYPACSAGAQERNVDILDRLEREIADEEAA